MASLSDQIDRFTRHTRAITTSLSQTAKSESTSSDFTQAVLYTHLGDLIRDIDPSELGLFTLVENTPTPYDKDARLAPDPSITRAHFPGATPLRRRPASQDPNFEIEPEVYAHAALKYIEQYEPIRAMPRAYERVGGILNRLQDIRKRIAQLNLTLKQVSIAEELSPIKTLLETEESSIQDLQARITYLSKKKLITLKPKKVKPTRPTLQPPALRQNDVKDIIPLSSSQEDQFWSNKGETGRTLCFTDNLMDEESNLADVSIDDPSMELGHLSQSKSFDEGNSFIEERTIIQTVLVEIAPEVKEESPTLEMPLSKKSSPATGRSATPSELASSLSPANSAASNLLPTVNYRASKSEELPRQHRIKVNREVEKIVAKIWLTLGDTIPLPNCSIVESISYLQNLASQIPQLESPVASSASSVSIETNAAPTAQQVLTASLLTMLLASNSNYSLPLNQVKENLTLKAKTAGMSVVGQGTTRVLYGCVAKRLVKIDRGGREQVVKFDI